tara:strand:- start:26 stop:244 length:219 start_codon:yes stop_codon:yes gene_type:complete
MNNCIDCKHCKFHDFKVSPAGVMIITDYKCDNSKSKLYGTKMNSIQGPEGVTLDSREKNTCKQFESSKPKQK